jgi:ABC-type bacteriocin/lantibiotic exporter with double-glycine peptidase domain
VAKLVAVGTPFLYKAAVDSLAGETAGSSGWLWPSGAVGVTVAYGMARLANVGFQQLRDAIFARVAQGALRQLALETFQHIHALSLRYHITRRTGGLEPDHRARREGGGVPPALPAVLRRAADPRACC